MSYFCIGACPFRKTGIHFSGTCAQAYHIPSGWKSGDFALRRAAEFNDFVMANTVAGEPKPYPWRHKIAAGTLRQTREKGHDDSFHCEIRRPEPHRRLFHADRRLGGRGG
jgi:hypothetical protein